MRGGSGRALVLCYHTVSTQWQNSVAVRPEALRAQLTLVLEQGYLSVTFSEAVARPDRRVVAVTFDDAFLAVRRLALPVLDDLDMVGTVFAPTTFVESGQPLRWEGYDGDDVGSRSEMAPLSWTHLRELTARGWEVGSHTRRHPHLPRLDSATLRAELRDSREECSAGVGAPCTSIAYPYGDVNARVRDAAAKAGYRTGAALGPQWRRGDPLWWPRTGVYGSDDLRRFTLKVSGVARSRVFDLAVTSARRLPRLSA